ncbi:MAG: DUF3596 domain-containing protein [Campylobacterales bacterium]|nr:DUF3596 domain-containing protein [Campylobacterales bacterium]
MASITKKTGSNRLYIDFMLGKKRVQKSTGLVDTAENRRIIEKEIIPKLEAKIRFGELSPKQTADVGTFGRVSRKLSGRLKRCETV